MESICLMDKLVHLRPIMMIESMIS